MSSLEQHTSVASPGIKIATAWGTVAFASWSEVASTLASVLAALYTFLLICEWLWKKCGRSFCESRGWVQSRKRRKEDQ